MTLRMHFPVLTGHGRLDELQDCAGWPVPVPEVRQTAIRIDACGLDNTTINTRATWVSKSVTEGVPEPHYRGGFTKRNAPTENWLNTTARFSRIQRAAVARRIAAVGEGADATGTREQATGVAVNTGGGAFATATLPHVAESTPTAVPVNMMDRHGFNTRHTGKPGPRDRAGRHIAPDTLGFDIAPDFDTIGAPVAVNGVAP